MPQKPLPATRPMCDASSEDLQEMVNRLKLPLAEVRRINDQLNRSQVDAICLNG